MAIDAASETSRIAAVISSVAEATAWASSATVPVATDMDAAAVAVSWVAEAIRAMHSVKSTTATVT